MGSISDQLLDTLYGAPLMPELWPEALAQTAAHLSLHGCAILHTDLTGQGHNAYFSTGLNPEISRLYAAGYGELDVYRPRFMKLATSPDRILMGDELCDFQSIKRSVFGQDILRKGDIRLWCAVATVHTKAAVENISLYHPWNSDPPPSSELARVRQVLPHLNNALRLRARISHLEGVARDLHGALHQSASAIILFDHSGRCAFVNAQAETLLRRRDGLLYQDRTLAADNSEEASALQAAIRRAVAANRREQRIGSVVRVTRRNGSPLHIRVSPLPGNNLLPSAKYLAIAVVGARDVETRFPAEAVRSIYRLTPSESKIAALMMAGHSLQEASEILHITKETARTQIKAVFQKTGTRRQGELISLLSGIPR